MTTSRELAEECASPLRVPRVMLTPEGERALAQAKRWRRDQYRRVLYGAVFLIAFALGTLCGLVLR